MAQEGIENTPGCASKFCGAPIEEFILGNQRGGGELELPGGGVGKNYKIRGRVKLSWVLERLWKPNVFLRW
jgi:hypothetical protein